MTRLVFSLAWFVVDNFSFGCAGCDWLVGPSIKEGSLDRAFTIIEGFDLNRCSQSALNACFHGVQSDL